LKCCASADEDVKNVIAATANITAINFFIALPFQKRNLNFQGLVGERVTSGSLKQSNAAQAF
jgi:hypothetical protein